ncbi:hypothetical protein ACS0TY_014395 [Phlomoides rotata]
MTNQEPRDLMKYFEITAQNLGGMNTPGVVTGASGNVITDPLTSGESVVTLMVDKLNEMLRQVVATALASHLMPPVIPTTVVPTPATRADSWVPGSGVVPVQDMPPPPTVPAVERGTRGGDERMERSSKAMGVDESDSEEEESGSQVNVRSEITMHLEIIALRREMNEMKKRYENMANPTFKPVGSPFSEEILMDPLPRNFKTLTYEYDGTNDPQDHLLRFENGSLLHQNTDGVKCRVFLTTLTKSAQQWFGQLPQNSIHSFSEFRTMFNKAALEVPTTTNDVKVNAFDQGLHDSDFFKSLAKRPPKTFDELLDRAGKYTNLEEARGLKKVEEKGSTPKKEEDKKKVSV